jgi:putative transposase
LTAADEEARRRAERARRVALFRYELIQDVIDVRLSTKQRGPLVRAIAAREHDGPFGEKVTVSRQTIDRWCRWWKAGGFAALVPRPAKVTPRTPAEVLDMAAALKRENLARTAAQVARILRAQSGWSPTERTPATPLRTSGASRAGAEPGAGVRPVRSRPTQRVVGRRCPPRSPRRRT